MRHPFRTIATRSTLAATAVTLAILGSNPAPVLALQPAAATPARSLEPDAWRDAVWEAAKRGDNDQTLDLLQTIPDAVDAAGTADLRAAVDLLRINLDKRESSRDEQLAELRERFTEELEAAASGEPADLSDALSTALFLEQVVRDPEAFHQEPEVRRLIEDAANAAARAEAEQQWLDAAELYARLNLLTEASQRFKTDVERQILRRDQLTLYIPERYWEMRDARLRELEQRALERWHADKAENPDEFNEDAEPPTVKGLPPYNPRGDDYTTKLADITPDLALAAIVQSSRHHITATTIREMVIGGLEVIDMLIQTDDMALAFPTLADAAAVSRFEAYLDEERILLENANRDLSIIDLRRTLNRVLVKNEETVNLPSQVVIHEFGAGAMNTLDEFSAIIWPHELRSFYKRLGSSFIGVGIQITNDPITGDLEVYTPLSGMPAMRAGVRAGDIITHVDGEPMIGVTTDQAVDIITGPKGTEVTLTVRRTNADGEEITKDITIVRDEIDIPTVTGWKRLRPDNRVDAWDWFIDRNQGIGYLRLEKFADESTRELDAAVSAMRAEGLRGLILDLRFNSGGQFDRAIEIVNRFVPRGTLVSTVNSRTEPPESHAANPGAATLADIPVVVLINSNSASASEIVAGAVKAHARTNGANAIVLGERSYGKGTVQNVHGIARNTAAMKVTTQYYQLPDGSVIHRQPGSPEWGVAPNLEVDLLPDQVTESALIRRNADIIQIDEHGVEVAGEDAERRDPRILIDEGIDLQLNTALVLLKTQVPAETSGTAMLDPR
ncbi:MAG: S41 family peptidase [Phycisphaerales bacterium]